MKELNGIKIIGVDHGYGNMKTANCVFGTGVLGYDKEPIFKSDMLEWNGRYYLIGTGHKEFTADKMRDEDYYVLTLAAVARELNYHGIRTADVFLAAGLPLKEYLMQNETVDFIFRGNDYHIRFVGVELFAQGFAAAFPHIKEFTGVNMLCDIGNGTMNLMFINDKKVDPRKCYTEKFGTHQCMLQVRENLMRLYHTEPPEEIVTRVLRFGEADIDPAYLKTIDDTAREYVEGIFQRLREHGYDPRLMKLYVVGGGGCLIRNFADYDKSRVTINDDICATVKGYERMAEIKLQRAGDGQ